MPGKAKSKRSSPSKRTGGAAVKARHKAPSKINFEKALRTIKARYDAAVLNNDNRKHWANADALSANAANSPEVRSRLRNHSRYEVANNTYARGIISTLTNDCVGSSPRLQMLTENDKINDSIEEVFSGWATEINLGAKLRTMRKSKAVDGEAFAAMIFNPLLRSPVKLDLTLIEADRIYSPFIVTYSPLLIDGIKYDEYGNPRWYYVLRNHPGDSRFFSSTFGRYDIIQRSAMLHYFNVERPGQARGIPELTAALPLFALLRDYTLATRDAAKAAAYFAAVLYTEAPADPEEAESEFDTMELERNTATTLPFGYRLGQVKAEHPNGTFMEFGKTILNEIFRCVDMPFNIGAVNSAGYNYSSGRMDHQVYRKSIGVERSQLEADVTDRLFAAFANEAVLIEGLLPQETRNIGYNFRHQWHYDGWEPIDETKTATAQQTKLVSFMTNYATEFAKDKKDWRAELLQSAKEQRYIKEIGLVLPSKAAPEPQATAPIDEENPDDEVPVDDGENSSAANN